MNSGNVGRLAKAIHAVTTGGDPTGSVKRQGWLHAAP